MNHKGIFYEHLVDYARSSSFQQLIDKNQLLPRDTNQGLTGFLIKGCLIGQCKEFLRSTQEGAW